MTSNLKELTQSLRDAADQIDKAAGFKIIVSEEIDLAEAVSLIDAVRDKKSKTVLSIEIEFDYSAPPNVKYSVTSGYKIASESADFQTCLQGYLRSKESPDSLASVARLVKKACKIQEVALATEPEQA
jgi:hypothetical protein